MVVKHSKAHVLYISIIALPLTGQEQHCFTLQNIPFVPSLDEISETEEQKEVAQIKAINIQNQKYADHREGVKKMRLLAKKSIRLTYPIPTLDDESEHFCDSSAESSDLREEVDGPSEKLKLTIISSAVRSKLQKLFPYTLNPKMKQHYWGQYVAKKSMIETTEQQRPTTQRAQARRVKTVTFSTTATIIVPAAELSDATSSNEGDQSVA